MSAPTLRRALALWALSLLACPSSQDLGAARRCAPDDASCEPADAAAERCASPSEARACYSGPAETRAVGRCHGGVVRCDPLSGRFAGACEGEELPSVIERCGDAIDDDCDGAVDEDCALPRLVAVVAGDRASCALSRGSEGARVACWGDGASGIFRAAGPPRVRPERVGAPAETVALAMGASHLCALASGAVWCLGRNDAGTLGDGTFTSRASFARVEGVPRAVELVAGRFHACARADDGGVWCWGSDAMGQCGGAAAAWRPCARGASRGCVPRATRVAGLPAARALTAGFEHTCALTGAGEVWCWGAGAAFRATSSVATLGSPERAFEGAARVVAGGVSTCVAREGAAGSSIECHGRLAALAAPIDARAQVFAGGARWCFATPSRALRCSTDGWWPSPDAPGLESDPLELTELSSTAEPLRQMSVGISHACALWGDRAVRCWGENAFGELGVGSTVSWNEPQLDVAW